MPLASPPGLDLSLTPVIPPPPGVTPDFVNPVSCATDVLAASAVATALMLVFVSARLYAKFAYARSQLGWDDVFCVMGVTTSMVYIGFSSWLLHSGLGTHTWDISLERFFDVTNVFTIGTKAMNVVYAIAMIFTKFSIFFLFFRIFQISRRARVWIYIGIIATLITHIIGVILYLTAGSPSSPESNIRYVERLKVIQVGVCTANIVGDFYILLLPLIEVSRLQMKISRKLGVSAIFATGFLACVAGILGIFLRVISLRSADVSWKSAPLVAASLYEIDIGLIVGCMPILPLFVKHSKGLVYLRSLPSRILSYRSLYKENSRSSAASRDKTHVDLDRGESFEEASTRDLRRKECS